jgi:brefeldin A-inhibited guanine nucleotide-exchange protein
LNYDCDRSSLDNIYERLVNIISRISTTQFTTVTPAYHPKEGKEGKELDSNAASAASWTIVMPFLPSIPTTISTMTAEVVVPYFGQPLSNPNHTIETQLKRQSLDCLVSILHSLVAWAGRTPSSSSNPLLPSTSSSTALHEAGLDSPAGGSTSRNSEDDADRSTDLSRDIISPNASTPNLPAIETFDDPGRFETAKLRKTTLLEGIRKFNYKPKRVSTFPRAYAVMY